MSLTTSTQFASSIHSGTDWRDASKKVLDDLQGAITDGYKFNLGILYISDHLAADAKSILNLFQTVLNIPQWVGSIGIGVCGSGDVQIDQPAISAMIGAFPDEHFKMFSAGAHEDLKPWLVEQDAMLVLSHAHPGYEREIVRDLQTLETLTNGFCMGGVSMCRSEFMPKKDPADATEEHRSAINVSGGVDGVALSDQVPVMTMLSQGCRAIGPAHVIARAEGNVIYEFEDGLAQDVFENDLREMVIEKIDQDPDLIESDDGKIPSEYEGVFTGEVLVAFPLNNSDNGEYLVRNILRLDEDKSMSVAHQAAAGERVMFIHRDDQTLQADLSTHLLAMRKRIEDEVGPFVAGQTIKGGIYISCGGRAMTHDGLPNKAEVDLISEILGDFPLCGFYAGGEIKGPRLFGYTGILTLFL